MFLKSIILGIAVTVVLLAVLVATRLMVLAPVAAGFEIREVETVNLAEPPPPPPEPAATPDLAPPPPPALADLNISPDISQTVLPVSHQRINPRPAIEVFFTDQPPAPLPTIARPAPQQVSQPQATPSSPPRMAPAPPQPKSEYSLGELDQQPRLLRNPAVVFPRSIKDATSGRVVIRVAIQPSGSSEFVSVVSSTHPDLVPLAQRIANGSRFTPPTRQGKAVRAVMTWPITIKK